MTTARLSTLALGVLAVVAMTACHPASGTDPDVATAKLEQALAPPEVRLVVPEVEEWQPTLRLVGEVRPFEQVTLSTEVVGVVDRVLVEVGDRVAAGQPLVEVDRTTFALRLAQAEANLAATEAELALTVKELERKRDLVSDQTIAQAVFDQAEAANALAKARLGAAAAARDLARRDWERSVVRAPAAGMIAKRHAAAGQWADLNQMLLELAVGAELKVAAQVPESWLPNLAGLDGFDFSVGANVTVHRARLFSIEPVVSQASRSFEVVGTARVGDGSVRPGMFANVTLVAPTAQRSLWVPATAVATSDTPQVLLVENGVIVVRRVQTGRRVDGRVEVVAGLEPSEAVVTAVAGLGRGVAVTVVSS